MSYCNNCGKSWHTYKYCKLPITSIGVILVRYNQGICEYLLICRKKSLGYVDFLRGRYTVHSHAYILNLLDEMTLCEKHDLLTCDFDDLWRKLWGITTDSFVHEECSSRDKFNQLRKEVLPQLIHESNTSWTTPEWGFPKGRRNVGENDVMCALREFQEETGYDMNSIDLIKNIIPYEETFIGSNYKKYRHKYFVAFIPYHVQPTQPFQEHEVSDMKWLTLEQALEQIRPYNTEKKETLEQVDRMLQSYILV